MCSGRGRVRKVQTINFTKKGTGALSSPTLDSNVIHDIGNLNLILKMIHESACISSLDHWMHPNTSLELKFERHIIHFIF